MPESAWFRGEGGGLHKFDLPLPEVFAQQERQGRLVRVDPAALAAPAVSARVVEQPAETDADEASAGDDSPERPSRADNKDAWVAWAHHVSKRPVSELDDMTKAQLVAEYGG